MIAEQQIQKVLEDKGWKTSADIPLWQVNYEGYGGYDNYVVISKLYWDISNYYLYEGSKYNATNFPLIKADVDDKALLERFRRDLQARIEIPKEYDKYR